MFDIRDRSTQMKIYAENGMFFVVTPRLFGSDDVRSFPIQSITTVVSQRHWLAWDRVIVILESGTVYKWKVKKSDVLVNWINALLQVEYIGYE